MREYPLEPEAACWLDLVGADAPTDVVQVFTLLDAGVLEVWQGDDGCVRFYDAKTGARWGD